MTEDRRYIEGRRRVELPDLEETVFIGETLPPEYDNVLKEVEERSASNKFKVQAREVIYYFYALDKGKKLVDSNDKRIDLESFANLVASMHYVTLMYMKANRDRKVEQSPLETNGMITRRRVVSNGNPETAFPEWVRTNIHLNRKETIPDYSKLREFYEEWSNKHAESRHQGTQGFYSDYPKTITPEESDKVDARFKGYIEVSVSDESLKQAFNILSEKKVHPHSSKFFDGFRIVLYWFSAPEPELLASIKQAFATANVPFRGPGQDSDYFVRKNGGEIEMEFRVSNDQALGEGNSVEFNQENFNPTTFLRNYLEQCYRYWRNPLNPYLLSFFPAFDKSEGNLQDLLKLQNKVDGELVLMNTWVPSLFS